MKTLFTAFKGKNNTSFRLVDQLGGSHLLLTNSFSGLEKDISALTKEYGCIYMFGIDPGLKNSLRIETAAAYEKDSISTAFDISGLSEELRRAGISHEISQAPGRYLCNAAYYHMLKGNPASVFLHIPSQRGMEEDFMEKLVSFFRHIPE